MLLVFGGTFGAAIAGGTMADAKDAVKALVKRAFTGKAAPAGDAGPDRRRRSPRRPAARACWRWRTRVKDIDDAVPRSGRQMAIDGTDPEELRDILEAEVTPSRPADKHGAKFFTDVGGYAPTIGIIGTVMGLVHVLENLAEPEELGHLIAGAFVATLWGVHVAPT